MSPMGGGGGIRPGLLSGVAMLLFAVVGCDSGGQTLRQVDGGALPVAPTFEAVQQILDRNCVPCHHSGGGEEDAPRGLSPAEDDRDYSSCDGILEDLDDILDTAVDGESMPPGAWPRLTEEEKLVILDWVHDGACSPCNPCR